MSRGKAKPLPARIKRPLAPCLIQLDAAFGVDRLSIKAWIEHMRSLGRDDLAEEAERAASFFVRRRWPKSDTPLPRIPIDFHRRIVPDN